MKLDEIAKQDIDQILSPEEVRNIVKGQDNNPNSRKNWTQNQIKKLLVYAVLRGYRLDLDSQSELSRFFLSFWFISSSWNNNPKRLGRDTSNFFQYNSDKSLSARILYNDYQKHLPGNIPIANRDAKRECIFLKNIVKILDVK